jgi:3-deoxy-7-phosphoheptulonate synthase
MLDAVKKEFGLGIVTEATDVETFSDVERVADLVQIGARNMQNFALLRRAGRCGKPVMLKRGQGATLEEWLWAAEYILSEGNPSVILCERGIRTWSTHARYTFDVSAIPAAKALSHLPVIADPSHAAGRRDLVIPCALAGVAAGADGILVEIHCQPAAALSDGQQALLPDEFMGLASQARAIKKCLNTAAEGAGMCI